MSWRTGYCSDPDYAENLIGLIEDYELYRYDVGDVDPGEVTRVALSESKHHAARRSELFAGGIGVSRDRSG